MHSANRIKLLLALTLFVTATLALAVILEGLPPAVAAADSSPIAGTLIGPTTGPDYGVVFMSSAEETMDEQRYQNAISTGATWNRWPMYWSTIEPAPGVYNWSSQDATVLSDLAHGLQINAILLGTPGFYTTGLYLPPLDPRPTGRVALFEPERATPVGLYEPVFSDGSDVPGPGKSVNPANVWARFVFAAVERYRPGGTLASLFGWPEGVGVTHWEMWNEPDLSSFWDGSLTDYARLLKVGYLAARQADPQAVVLFGGLANNFQWLSFYEEVLTIYDGDPLASVWNYFHDILATHNYFVAYRAWEHVERSRQSLTSRGLDKPIWLNESGVPAWDDYPGPTWDPTSGLRATLTEQADFVVQNALYAAFAGVENIFHFQLYDGCGNQPQGTDFPPHNGELCDANGNLITDPNFPCAGDANGLFSNPTDAACFRQHPTPETPRLNYDAFRLLTEQFREVEPLWWLRSGGSVPGDGPQEWLAFYKPATGERIIGMWARFGHDEVAAVPAISAQATLISPTGIPEPVTAVNGEYTFTLPAATNHNAFWDPNFFAIGGRPFLLVEQDSVAPLAAVSGPYFAETVIPLIWSGDDGLGGGVGSFDVSVSQDGEPATAWLTGTQQTGGVYTAEIGHTYTFFVIAYDRAGNGSAPAEWETVTISLPEKNFLPLTRH